MRSVAVRGVVGVAGLAVAAALTACGGQSGSDQGAATGAPAVVASTDVWGSVAGAVSGGRAKVTSIITGTVADPHSFEATPADAAAITDAGLVVFNGGGYDQWVEDVLAGRNIPSVDAYSLLDAAALGEPTPANEHVFYDLGTAKTVATKIAEKLAAADPAGAAGYRTNAEAFGRAADAIGQSRAAIRAAQPGATVVATEPTAHYLLLAAGLTDKTPPGFANAVEQDTDPAPVDVAAMLDLIKNRQVAALVFNEQTVTEATRQVQAAAQAAGVAVVAVTETLPAGSDYLSWQRDTTDRLAAALQQSRP